ncbi:MAG: hypothetical protein JO089_02165, partial [Alphaproteobacteria bacterium]|nr:hypothetical protein [Alphaproteobacteria bacterium]
ALKDLSVPLSKFAAGIAYNPVGEPKGAMICVEKKAYQAMIKTALQALAENGEFIGVPAEAYRAALKNDESASAGGFQPFRRGGTFGKAAG